MLDLHRHDEHSSFDGFGKPTDLAKLALEKGHKALGIANHGNTSSLIEHYFGCKEVGIKPIMGVEAYFQPVFNPTKESPRFHLCLFAKNLQGYHNINRVLSLAASNTFYYKPIVTFESLAQYSEGVICTSACLAGPIAHAVVNGNKERAERLINKFVEIYDDDFYIEIQPYVVSDPGLQEKVNLRQYKLAQKHGVKCILTSDSHFGSEDDLDTYLKMHEMGHTTYDVRATYGERYMPTDGDLERRFIKMHGEDFEDVKLVAKRMRKNLAGIIDKVDDEILELLPLNIPKVRGLEDQDSKEVLRQKIVKGLKRRGLYNKKYLDRCKEEYEVICHHGFEDYFLIVTDYVVWAKKQGIEVGPGRGSVCNCEVAYALGITEVDSLYFGMDFTRFLRLDKKKLPDIDLDFETDRRHEVIEYLIHKYPKQAIQISSYGLYKIDNLLNDLFKVCGVESNADKAYIKQFVKSFENTESVLDTEAMLNSPATKQINKKFDNIIKHFILMYKKVRYLGTHAAGVAIVGDDITKYTAIRKAGDKLTSAYDLNDLERINAIKFDILGLKTMSVVHELKQMTGAEFEYSWLDDEQIYDHFREGNTAGIFQFEKKAAKNILQMIHADCFEDIIAANALNRPGPLSLKMPEQYAANKVNSDLIKDSAYFEYTKQTYGTIVYQEQISAICRGIGQMSWPDSDKVLKFLKGTQMTERALKVQAEEEAYLFGEFYKGAKAQGYSKQEAKELFQKITVYSFNKGHAAGYSLISFMLMWYKIHFPVEFWYTAMKYASDESNLAIYKAEAIKMGNVVLLPHVNASAQYSINTIDGEEALQEGMVNIKNVGEKAALVIEAEREKNGKFTNMDDFLSRVPKRSVNSRCVQALKDAGALEFNKKTYFSRVVKYNSTLYAKGLQNG